MAKKSNTVKRPKLPIRVYVKREMDQNHPSESYLLLDETLDSMEDGEVVGIYELVETKTMQVTRLLK